MIQYQPDLLSGPGGDATRDLFAKRSSSPVNYGEQVEISIHRILPVVLDDVIKQRGISHKEYLCGTDRHERFWLITAGMLSNKSIFDVIYVSRKSQYESQKHINFDKVKDLPVDAKTKLGACLSVLFIGCSTVQLQQKDSLLEECYEQIPASRAQHIISSILKRWITLAIQL